MEQELAFRKDNKELRSFVRAKIFSDLGLGSYHVEESCLLFSLEDYYLPSIIYFFYKQEGLNFYDYLGKISLKSGDYSAIYSRIKTNLSTILNLDTNSDSNQYRLLGDIHPNFSTKILSENYIKYRDYPDYGDVVKHLSEIIFKDSDKIFPNIKKEKNIFLRDYFDIKDNTSNDLDIE